MLFSCRNPLTRACYPTFADKLENDVRKRENCLLSEIRNSVLSALLCWLYRVTVENPLLGRNLVFKSVLCQEQALFPIVGEELNTFQLLTMKFNACAEFSFERCVIKISLEDLLSCGLIS